ncbi:hypothetical protein N9023_00105 [Opitutaceae bacterium]|nr:hypothetical protein [Opitutaceae bacterium]
MARYHKIAWALAALPLIAAVIFVHRFAGPLPLTDEWSYTHALRLWHGLDLTSWEGISTAWENYPARHSEHLVVLPFIVYAPLMELFSYDSRIIIYLTVASFAALAFLFRPVFKTNPWLWGLVCLILFCPSHYMEFMWAWQITLTWSVLFPVLGLYTIDRRETVTPIRNTFWGILAISLGTLSSAGGFFGFPAALLLVLLRENSIKTKLIQSAVVAGGSILIYTTLMSSAAHELSAGTREFWYILTVLGGTLWGTPVAVTEFRPDSTSIGGLLVLIALSAVLVRIVVIKKWAELALPLSITIFGFLSIAPIAISREYLGNWHLQYALPIFCGGLATAYTLHRLDRSKWSLSALSLLVVLLGSSLVGYVQGFNKHGPVYRAYVQGIEEYTQMKLSEHWRGRSYPEQHPDRDMDLDLILFLAAHDHPTLQVDFGSDDLAPLPPRSRVWINNEPQSLPLPFADGPKGSGRVRVIVGIPSDENITLIVGQNPQFQTTLRRVHPGHFPDIETTEQYSLFVADIFNASRSAVDSELQFLVVRK